MKITIKKHTDNDKLNKTGISKRALLPVVFLLALNKINLISHKNP